MNLGDIDRSGHVDESGASAAGGLSAFRQTAMRDTDVLLGQFVDELKSTGAWEQTVLIFTSDHGMDWGTQDQDMNAEKVPQAAGYGADSKGEPGRASGSGSTMGEGDYYGAGNGGAAMLYVEEEADVEPIARLVAAQPGVEFIATKEPIPGVSDATLGELGLDHPYAGDIVVFAEPGWAEHSTFTSANPLPGNHGHGITQNSVLMVAGGHPALDDEPESVSGLDVYDPPNRFFSPPTEGPGNMSVAPTVAALLGIGEPEGGYDVGPLREAFEPWALEPHDPCSANEPPRTLSIDDVAVSEGNSGTSEATFTISLEGTSQKVITVDYRTSDETAEAPGDYTAVETRTLFFDPGETEKTLSVPVRGDLLDEPDETFTVDLSNPVNAGIAKARGTATIADDDASPSQTAGDAPSGSSAPQSTGRTTPPRGKGCKRFKSKHKRRACARKKRPV